MNRYFVLYLAALIVLTGLDFLFLGVVAKGFFTSEVGDMLGGIRIAPAIPIYLLYGALFGLFCYATFDLTSLSLLKHCSWPVAVVDVCGGATVTAAASSTAGLLVANWLAPKI